VNRQKKKGGQITGVLLIHFALTQYLTDEQELSEEKRNMGSEIHKLQSDATKCIEINPNSESQNF